MIQKIFEKIVENPFSKTSIDELKLLSVAVWHRGFVPDVSNLTGVSALKAMYLIDNLMRFNCVSFESKLKLKSCISELSVKVIYQKSGLTNLRLSKLAMHYGLNEDLKLKIRECLYYQTRHYSAIERKRLPRGKRYF